MRTDHKPLIKVLEQRPEKASPRKLNQLDYISQFCLTLQHVNGSDNVVADALSRIEAIDMPSSLNPEAIHRVQQEEEVSESHELANSSLLLSSLVVDGFRILCDVSTGLVRPYLLQQIRRREFDTVHSPAHPSGRVTVRMLKEKFVWPGIKADALK